MRGDAPGEALLHYLAKRSPEGAPISHEVYRKAEEHTYRMPQYSTIQSRALPSRMDVVENGLQGLTSLLPVWTSLGPNNIGGRTRVVATHPSTEDVLYAASVSGGIFKSTNAGGSWQPVQPSTQVNPGSSIQNLAVCALVVIPADTNPIPGVNDILVAGTGEGFFAFDAVWGDGIWRSTDSGATWAPSTQLGAADFRYVNDIVRSERNPNNLYAATSTGIFRSTNKGAPLSWVQIYGTTETGGVTDLAIRTDDGVGSRDELYAAVGTYSPYACAQNPPAPKPQTKIIRTMDARVTSPTWTDPITLPPGPWGVSEMGRISLAIARTPPIYLYVLVSRAKVTCTDPPTDLGEWGLYALHRADLGVDPPSFSTPVTGTSGEPGQLILSDKVCGTGATSGNGWYHNVIAVDPKDSSIVWAGGVNLFRSTNAGTTWGVASFWNYLTDPNYPKPDGELYLHEDQHTLVFQTNYSESDPSRQKLYVGNDGGVFRTEAARGTTTSAFCPIPSQTPVPGSATWVSRNAGYQTVQFYNGIAASTTEYLGGTQDNSTMRVAATPPAWERTSNAPGGDGGYVVATGSKRWGGGIRKDFQLLTAYETPPSLGGDNLDFLFIAPFVKDPDPAQPGRIWTGGRRPYRGTGFNGASPAWQELMGPPAPKWGHSVSAIAVNLESTGGSPGNLVFMGRTDGTIAVSENARRTNPLPTWGDLPSCGGKGVQWCPRDGFISWLAIDHSVCTSRAACTLYATYSTIGGDHVWRTTDGGSSWETRGGSGATALPNIPVHVLVVDPTSPTGGGGLHQRLYVGTDQGIYVSTDGGGGWMKEYTGFPDVPVESLALDDVSSPSYLYAFTHGRGAYRVPLCNTAPSVPQPTPTLRHVGTSCRRPSAVTQRREASWLYPSR